MSDFQRIQQALIDAVRAAKFPKVTFDKETGKATVGPTEVDAISIVANEIAGGFSRTAHRDRRSDRVLANVWRWELSLGFEAGQVDCSKFEAAVGDPPLKVPAAGPDAPQLTLILEKSEYKHPPFQDPTTGSKVRYEFVVLVNR